MSPENPNFGVSGLWKATVSLHPRAGGAGCLQGQTLSTKVASVSGGPVVAEHFVEKEGW